MPPGSKAGPSGLSAAYHLTRLGHSVTVREAGPVAGGMLHFGIPAYRLPRDVLAAEVERIRAFGVRMEFDHKVNDLKAEQDEGEFDPVMPARSSMRSSSCARSTPGTRRAWAGGWRSTAAATPPWTRPGWPAAWAPTKP